MDQRKSAKPVSRCVRDEVEERQQLRQRERDDQRDHQRKPPEHRAVARICDEASRH
jgi:hypothetical protein